MRLERLHLLDRHNRYHLWLLHHMFLDLINKDCDAFKQEWNAHPLSGHKNKSPLVSQSLITVSCTNGMARICGFSTNQPMGRSSMNSLMSILTL